MSQILNLESKISNIKKKLELEEPDISDISDSSESESENEEENEKKTMNQSVVEVRQEEIKQEDTVETNEEEKDENKETVDEPTKLERTKKVDEASYDNNDDDESDDEDTHIIEFVINKIDDNLKFFQKTIYKLIARYQKQQLMEDDVVELCETYDEELESFEDEYEHCLLILPQDKGLPDKIYDKFEKTLYKIEKKWNSFLLKINLVS